MGNESNSTSATPTASGEPDSSWDDMLLVGVVARTQGNKGEVIVNGTTDFPELRFAPGTTLWGRPAGGRVEPLVVGAMRMHLGRPVVAFGGVANMDAAQRLAGCELRIPAGARQVLPAHVYYRHDLIGCTVVTGTGEAVGPVTAVEGDGGAVRLVVSAPRGQVLIPLAQEFCAVDLAGRRIVVTPPEGLLEVNGGWP